MNYEEFHERIFKETASDVVSFGRQGIKESLKLMILDSDIPTKKKTKLIEQVDDIHISDDRLIEYMKNAYINEGIISFPSLYGSGKKILGGLGKVGAGGISILKNNMPYFKQQGKKLAAGVEKVVGKTEKAAGDEVEKMSVGMKAARYGGVVLGLSLAWDTFVESSRSITDSYVRCQEAWDAIKRDLGRVPSKAMPKALISSIYDIGKLSFYFTKRLAAQAYANIASRIKFSSTITPNERIKLDESLLNLRNLVKYNYGKLDGLETESEREYVRLMSKPDLSINDVNDYNNIVNKLAHFCSFDESNLGRIPIIGTLVSMRTGFPMSTVAYGGDIIAGIAYDIPGWKESDAEITSLTKKGFAAFAKSTDHYNELYLKVKKDDAVKEILPIQSDPTVTGSGSIMNSINNFFNQVFFPITYRVSNFVTDVIFRNAGKILGVGTVLGLISLGGYYVWKKWFKNRHCESATGNERIKCEIDAVDQALEASRKEIQNCQYSTNPKNCMEEAEKLLKKWEDRKFELMKSLNVGE